MKHSETDTGPSDPPVPLMTRTALSHNSGIPASIDNLVSCAQADGNGNMSFAPSG